MNVYLIVQLNVHLNVYLIAQLNVLANVHLIAQLNVHLNVHLYVHFNVQIHAATFKYTPRYATISCPIFDHFGVPYERVKVETSIINGKNYCDCGCNNNYFTIIIILLCLKTFNPYLKVKFHSL